MKRKMRVFAILMTTLLLILALSGCSKKEGGEGGGESSSVPLEQNAETHNISVGVPKDFITDARYEGRGLDIGPSDYSYSITIMEETFNDMGTEDFNGILEYHKSQSEMIDNPYGDIAGRETAVFLDDIETTDAIMVFVDLSGQKEGLDYLWIEVFPSDESSPKEIYKKDEVIAILKSIKLK